MGGANGFNIAVQQNRAEVEVTVGDFCPGPNYDQADVFKFRLKNMAHARP